MTRPISSPLKRKKWKLWTRFSCEKTVRLAVFPAGSTWREDIWLAYFEGRPLSKCCLWVLFQKDVWNVPHGHVKHYIWYLKLFSSRILNYSIWLIGQNKSKCLQDFRTQRMLCDTQLALTVLVIWLVTGGKVEVLTAERIFRGEDKSDSLVLRKLCFGTSDAGIRHKPTAFFKA